MAGREQHRPDNVEALVAVFRVWLTDGPDHTTLTFSKRGGSVTLAAAAAHGGALEMLQRLAPQGTAPSHPHGPGGGPRCPRERTS